SKILRNFALPPSAHLAVMDEIVADLGRNHDFITLCRERFSDQLFAQSISVGIGRIKQRYAEIKGLMHEGNRFALGEIPPPTGGNRPQTEADLANRQIGVPVSAKPHRQLPN